MDFKKVKTTTTNPPKDAPKLREALDKAGVA